MKADVLTIVSYNMHGFFQGCPAIDNIIANFSPDVIALQEHWLTPSDFNKFDDRFPDYFTFGSSAMSNTVETGILRGRPFGGTIIMVNNRLKKHTTNIASSERYGAIKIGDCVIVNVYLPCSGTENIMLIIDDVFTDCISWCERFPDCNYVMAGDFNADLQQSWLASKLIDSFISQHGLHRSDLLFNKSDNITYDNLALKHSSTIDYIVSSSKDIFLNFAVLDPDINFSDHYPIIATCRVLISARSHMVSDASAISDVTVFRWDHADLSSYYEYTGA